MDSNVSLSSVTSIMRTWKAVSGNFLHFSTFWMNLLETKTTILSTYRVRYKLCISSFTFMKLFLIISFASFMYLDSSPKSSYCSHCIFVSNMKQASSFDSSVEIKSSMDLLIKLNRRWHYFENIYSY